MKRSCDDCEFYRASHCRRYPWESLTPNTYWCGEFRPRDKPAAPERKRLYFKRLHYLPGDVMVVKLLDAGDPDAELWEKVRGQDDE